MTERTRTALLLRGLAKLVLVAVVAGGAGLLAGLGVSTLSRGSGPQEAGGGPPKTVRPSTPGGGGSTPTNSQSPRHSQRQDVRIRVVSAVLRSAATAYGRKRQRARLIVQIRAHNVGKLPVTPARPELLAAGVTSRADSHANAAGAGLGSLGAGQRKVATLQFEVIGAVTNQLTTRRTARIVVAGHSLPVTVTLGPPV